MEALRARGHQILYITTASDFPFEKDPISKGYECPILQSYVDPDTISNIEKYNVEFAKLWAKEVFKNPSTSQWPMACSANLIQCAIAEVEHLKVFFKVEKPDLMIALHERNRWGKLLGHFCHINKVPYLTFQEGSYYEDRLSFFAHTEYTSTLLAWGEFTRDRLIRLGCDPEKIRPVGNTHIQGWLAENYDLQRIRKEYSIPPGKKVVLFLVGIQWGCRHNDPRWKNFLGFFKDNKEWVAVLKWHPKVTFNSYQANIEPFIKKNWPGCIATHNADIYKLIPISDFCVTLGKTTAAEEAMVYGKPLVSCVGFEKGSDDLVNAGVAFDLEPDKVQSWDFLSKPIPQEMQDRVNKYLGYYFYHGNKEAIELSVNEAERLIQGPYTDPVDPGFEKQFFERIKDDASPAEEFKYSAS